MTSVQQLTLLDVALGRVRPDVIIRDAEVINPYTREIWQADIVIKKDTIAFVGDAQHIENPARVLDAKGLYAIPGLIDTHIHLESSMLTVTEFARVVLPHGTTAVIIDPHELGSVLGLEGIRLILGEAKRVPLRVFPLVSYNIRSGVKEALLRKEILGTAEVEATSLLNKEPWVLSRIQQASQMRKVSDGHIITDRFDELNAVVAAGLMSDHESVTGQDAINRLRLGLTVMIREGSAAKNLKAIVKTIVAEHIDTRKCCLCTDDKDARGLMTEGHIDHVIRRAIRDGLDPVAAIQMGTLNATEYFNLDREFGSITPGKKADIILLKDLRKFKIHSVMIGGRTVARNGNLVIKLPATRYPKQAKNTFHLKRELRPQDLKLRVPRGVTKIKANVIVAIDGQIATEHEITNLAARNGEVECSLDKDILKLAVAERHRGTGEIGLGFVKNFNLRAGALASSVAHDSHNIIAVGTNDVDICLAVNAIARKGGGQIAVNNARILALLELPIAGLISDKPAKKVVREIAKLHDAACRMGSTLKAPFMTLSFLSCPLGGIRLTEKGLLDMSVTPGVYIDPIQL